MLRIDAHTKLRTLFLRSWLCSLLVSLATYGRLLLEDEGSRSRSRSLSLSPNQEKGMQVGMEVIDSAGDRFPPDSSSNSADPLGDCSSKQLGDAHQTDTVHLHYLLILCRGCDWIHVIVAPVIILIGEAQVRSVPSASSDQQTVDGDAVPAGGLCLPGHRTPSQDDWDGGVHTLR
ncbi:hypothetical protein EYF80_030801 [Liparis tanakae]|uniref:Uncharacterized protein n=1 Tax=Liparis tanakae TaxID=230148 RepID=A0A4Z2GZC2_9TELE|nr:hypothetical protein EYF80_030801 [Liparis tanakae]